jgi:hypothetical protein
MVRRRPAQQRLGDQLRVDDVVVVLDQRFELLDVHDPARDRVRRPSG